MDLDITIHKGRPGKPVVIFIHGLGVEKGFWTDPVNTKVLGRSIPMKVFAAKKPRTRSVHAGMKLTAGIMPAKTENLWIAVNRHNYNTVCWSQRRPVGPIRYAVEELKEIVVNTKRLFPGQAIALAGHSRGGLIARKFMEKKHPEIKALITIATPHAGSSLSNLGRYLSPLAPAVNKMLPRHAHGSASEVIKRVRDLFEGKALKELLPGSHFFKTLNDSPHKDIKYLSFGGTIINLLTVYKWKKKGDKFDPVPLLIIPDSLINILPARIIPDELTPGKGDFMVSAESSVLPWAPDHYNLPANHISIAWHKHTNEHTLELLEKL
jgi:pimeloyl-ACP methyl ester carboxylesterase